MGVLSYFPGSAGGAALNLKAYAAVGNLPASAAAGAVGVITATAIGDVFASASAPASPTNGDVWVWLGGSTRAPMALGEQITLAPRAVYQRVSSAWVIKPSYVYTGSSWVEVTLNIYDAGALFFVTGMTKIEGYGSVAEFTFQAAAIYFNAREQSTGSYIIVGFDGALDLTNVSQIKVTLDHTVASSTSCRFRFAISSNKTSTFNAYVESTTVGYNKVLTLDVSAYDGSYYLMMYANGWDPTQQSQGYVKKIELVR